MNWAILATGTIAAKFAETVNGMKGEDRLAACGSRSREKAEAFGKKYGIPRTYGSYEELLRDEEVDAVYVATPNNMHYENCMACLEAGKHVLCEKPFTTNVKEGERLFAAAEERGLFIMEAFWIRHLPALKKMQELINGGVIGQVGFARCDFGFVAEGARKARKFDSGLGGGALLDVGIYNLGFLRMVMGDKQPEHVTSEYHLNEFGTDDYSTVLLRYPGGFRAAATASIGMDMPREAAVFGSRGSIYLPDYQKAERLIIRPMKGEEYVMDFPFEVNGFEYQIREVNKCVRLGMSSSDVLKKEDTLDILRLMDDIRASWGIVFDCEK